MTVWTFELTFCKKRLIVFFNLSLVVLVCVFSYLTMLYHFRKLASLFRALFNVLMNQTIIFLLFKLFKLCLQGLDNLFQENLVNLDTFQFLWFFLLSFCDSQFKKTF